MFLLPHGSQNCTVTAIAADALTIESSQAGVPCASPNLGAESYHNPHSTLRRKTETRCQCGGGRCRRCLRCPVAVLLVMSRLEILSFQSAPKSTRPGSWALLSCARGITLRLHSQPISTALVQGRASCLAPGKTRRIREKLKNTQPLLFRTTRSRMKSGGRSGGTKKKQQMSSCQLAFPTSRARRKPPRSVAKGAWAVKRSVSQ